MELKFKKLHPDACFVLTIIAMVVDKELVEL